MKLLKYLKLFIFVFIVSSCSKDDDSSNQNQNFAERASSCENIIGFSGGYWDLANGIPVPFPIFPTLQNPGDQFTHSQLPLLGFTIPQGFSAFEINDPQTTAIGVDVIKNDNSVIYRWLPNAFILQNISSQDIIASQINALFSFYGFNGTPEVLCTSFQEQIFEGIPRQFNARLLRFNGRIAQVYVTTTYVASGTAFSISISTATENEYESEVLQTFLPLVYQLYVDPNGNIVDNDGDGWNVLVDPNDNDPNVPGNN